eukprot:SAG31_NODE_16423_length_710_cov_0.723404_1_plen_54_part_10
MQRGICIPGFYRLKLCASVTVGDLERRQVEAATAAGSAFGESMSETLSESLAAS